MTLALTKPASKLQSATKHHGKAKAGSDFNVAAHGLRGIASLMVFCAHILSGTAEHVYQANYAYVAAIQKPWHFGTYGVDLFFVLSGFVILPSVMHYSTKEFAIRRFLRLYPLFFVLSIIFVILNGATNEFPKLNTLSAIVSGFLFLNLINGTEQLTPNAWSLTYEVIFYAFTCVSVHFLFKRFNFLGAVSVMFLAGLFWAWHPIVTFFVIGIGIRALHDRAIFLPPVLAKPLEIGSLAGCIYFASQSWFEYSPRDMINPIAIAVMICTGVYFYCASTSGSLTGKLLSGRWVAYLGTVSYSLYLVHPYTYYASRTLFVKFGLFGTNIGLSVLLFYAVTVPITLVATHFVNQFLEVLPYKYFFRQSVYRAAKTGG
jgi:peptidoglycan/LPS O-acetylase OafA/YrhL